MADAWIESTLPDVISKLSDEPQFSALTSNADRVEFCLAQKEVQRWVGLFVSKFAPNQYTDSKCPNTAANYREKGNGLFGDANLKSAIELYSNAICFAPQTGDKTASELALAYGNRSAAYFWFGEHENALKDINAALALGYDQFKSPTKLQLRKSECLIKLGRASEAKEFLNLMQQPTDDEKDTNRWIELFGQLSLNDDKKKKKKKKTQTKEKSIPKACKISLIDKITQKGLFKSNEKMSSFSDKVTLHYDSVKGRHLVAREDIQFGDIIALSRPHAALLASKENALKFCEHCCRVIFEDGLVSLAIRPIPCSGCSSVVYCSEECRTESMNSYHRYECGHVHLLVQLPEFSRMSLRMLYKADLDQIRSVADSAEDSSHISEQPDDHYSHVYQLVHYSDGPLKDLNFSFEQMMKSSILACLLLQLVKNSNFPMNPKEDEKLIGGVLLRHHLQSRFNTFGYSPFNKEESTLTPILLELYPMFGSTLNNACKANAQLESSDNERVCLLQAARSISAGAEITICYIKSEDSEMQNSFPRPPQLFEYRHLVPCFCARCTYLSRITPYGISHAHLMLSCSDCGHVMEIASKQRSESEVFRCTNCRFTMTNAEVIRRYEKVGILESMYFQLHKSDEKPIWKMLAIIEKIKALLHRDSAVIGILYCLLGTPYLRNGQMDKYWECQERYLSIYESLHGKESVEFMDGLSGLQDVMERVEKMNPKMIRAFKQQDRKMYQRYMARVEQCRQLKRKYYPVY